MNKEQTYKNILGSIELLIENEDDLISVMSTITCELFHAFDHFNWVGFYRLVNENTLKVGPFQRTQGCLTINIEKGACGKCARENEMQIENDVSKIPYHIVCSNETQSEIVIPIDDENNKVRAVLDINSTEIDSFGEIDKKYLKYICDKVNISGNH